MILHEIFRVVSRFPRNISCYIAVNRFPLGQYIGYVNTPEHFIFTITTKNNDDDVGDTSNSNNNHGNKYDYDDWNMNNKMPQQWCLWRLHGGNSNNDNNNNDNSINNNNNSSHFAWSFNSTLINDFRWPGINEKCISGFFSPSEGNLFERKLRKNWKSIGQASRVLSRKVKWNTNIKHSSELTFRA